MDRNEPKLKTELWNRRGWLALSAGAGLAACGKREPGGTPIRTLRVGMAQTLAAAATISLGEEEGLFRDAGLALETTMTASGSTLIPSLVSGKVDLYIGSLSPALMTPEVLGAGVRVVLARDAVQPGCSTWGSIYGLKRAFPSGLKDLGELKGKRIAYTNRGSITEYALDSLAKAAGLKEGDVKGAILRQAEALGALAAGKIDGVLTISFSPVAKGELAERAALFSAMDRIAPGMQVSFILYGAALRGPERQAGLAFARAFLRSSQSFVSGKTPKNFDQLAEKNGLDPVSARSSCRNTAVAGGVVNLENIQHYADWALRKQYIETAVRAEDVVDSSIAMEAKG